MTDITAPPGALPRERASMIRGEALAVDQLPSYAFGARPLMFWGTLGVVAIEGTVFALAIVVYFYIRTQLHAWPPGLEPPRLIWGTVNVVLLLISVVPTEWTRRKAIKHDLGKVRIGIWICLAFALVMIVIRGLEFTVLNCRWDTNAYGSAVWLLLGLHTVHLVTDAYDTGVLATLFFTGPLEGKRYVDVSENAMYWYFVVLSWLPIYAVIYLSPRG